MTNKQAQTTINAIKFMLDHAQYSEDVEEALNMAINVLTAQPETHDKRAETHARDCISRQAAISLPVKPKEDRYFQTQNLDDAYDYGWYDLQECIEKLPPAQSEQRWIPCSERLPEEGQSILVTTTDNAWGDVVIIRTYYKEMHKSVIAWMPLPEPYREDKE